MCNLTKGAIWPMIKLQTPDEGEGGGGGGGGGELLYLNKLLLA